MTMTEALQIDTPPRTLTDAELVAACLSGDERAFASIMRRNNQRLFRVARSILGDDAEAEDAVQETYLNAFLHLDSFEGRSSLSTWLTRLAINESLGRVRSRRRRRLVPWDGFDEAGIANDWSRVTAMSLAEHQPERNAIQREMRGVLEDALDRLPESFRPAFVLREVEGMSGREVAEALDIPEATVKTRCFRARRLLQKDLRERLQGELGETFIFLGARCDRMVAAVVAKLRERHAVNR